MTKLLLIYTAVNFGGVAMYFYLRKKLRKWRERREERINAQPVIYYVYETFGGSSFLCEVFSDISEAELYLRQKEAENDNELRYYGIMTHREKHLVRHYRS
ncbi:hypothetical protein [Shouchella clausii]|uniref:hypothetical protein n=1 Tax=Shouchella clausii TaxID=79880 RepID=UPI000BA602A3|nr:hypothetical protein [Shouchella clausii]PAD91671.1 hypothetical protein CHH52_13700 [Shouchella clausii]